MIGYAWLPVSRQASQLVQSTIEKAGFVADPQKSVWEPTQVVVWHRFIVDVALRQIEVPQQL